jgi:DNA-binding XRE family transcriptional regulator
MAGQTRPGLQARQSTIVVVACTAQRNTQALRDVAQAQFLEACELQRGSLALRQLREARSNHPSTLLSRQLALNALEQSADFVERLASVRRARAKRGFAPQGSMIGVLEEPHSHRSTGWIVQMRLSVDLQEHLLCHVLRLAAVAQDVDRHPIDQPNVPAKQRSKRVAVRRVHVGHQFRVRSRIDGTMQGPLGAVAPHARPQGVRRLSMSLRYERHLDRWFSGRRQSGTQPRVSRRKPPVKTPRLRPAVLRPLGAQLRRLRLERKLSQESLAELAGLNYKYIGRIELAKADPGADVLVRLARALAVPVGELFETITPADASAYRFSPGDVESVAAALATLTTVVDRVMTRRPGPVPVRAPRRSRR